MAHRLADRTAQREDLGRGDGPGGQVRLVQAVGELGPDPLVRPVRHRVLVGDVQVEPAGPRSARELGRVPALPGRHQRVPRRGRVGEHGQPVDAVVISVHRAHDGRDARGAYPPVAVAASHEVAFDLAGLPVPVGVADHGLIRVKPVQRHVGRLEAQVTAVGEEGGDETAHQGLLRNRLPGGTDVGQVLGEQPALPVDANLEQVVRREAVQHTGRAPTARTCGPPGARQARRAGALPPGLGSGVRGSRCRSRRTAAASRRSARIRRRRQ